MQESIFSLKDFGIIPDVSKLQTEKIQKVLDLAGQNGGKVIVPAGVYRTGGLLMHSRTELYLEKNACLLGSDNPDDYPLFPIPGGVTMHTDMEMIPEYFADRKNVRPEYRRALISAYGAEDISVTGEDETSVIDGADCYDPEGEEHLRGPHGIFLSNCRNIRLCGYTIKNCGNFHHQTDTCENLTVRGLHILGGHDGFHLHCCVNADIADCVVRSGDDCIAGMNMENITVRDCDLNTSCQLFRIGGKHILVENCRLWGPGVYPYRASVVTDRDHIRPQNEGHHDIISLIEYFSSSVYPSTPSEDIVFRNCDVENPGKLLFFEYGADTAEAAHYCCGAPLKELIFENCRISGDCGPSLVKADKNVPLGITLKNVSCTDSTELFDGRSENLSVNVIS